MPTSFTEALLDDEGAISPKFESALATIFLRYASPTPSSSTPAHPPPLPTLTAAPAASAALDVEALFSNAHSMSRADLDRFSEDTNGKPMSDETFQEIQDFFDVIEEERLTFKGFLQLYQLQTENDEEETVNDLTAWGFDTDLELVTTRKEANEGKVDEGDKVPLSQLTGLGQGGERKSLDGDGK